MAVHQDNPAGRLHTLLTKMLAKPALLSVPQAWAEVLGVPPGQRPELLRLYALVTRLPDQIIAALDKIDPAEYDRDLCLRWQRPVRLAFGVDHTASTSVERFTRYLQGDALASLEMCDALLHRWQPGVSLAKSKLRKIRAQVESLERELAADQGIDEELREFLLFHVRQMAQAVRDVPVRGSAGLQEALDQALGDAFIRRSDLLRRVGTDRANKFLMVAQAVVLALQTSLAGLQLVQAAEAQSSKGSEVVVQVVTRQPPALPGAHTAPSGN